MRSSNHYTITTWSECRSALLVSLFCIPIALGALLYVCSNTLTHKTALCVILSFVLLFYVFELVFNLWKKNHHDHHILIDIGPDGITLNPQRAQGRGKRIHYLWEEIELIKLFPRMYGNFIITIKPYRKKNEKCTFHTFFWGNWIPRIIRATRHYSGRNDIIRKEPFGHDPLLD